MARLAAWALLVALAGPGSPAQVRPLSRSSAPIALYTGFEQPCPALVDASLRKELAEAMAPAGIYFEWRSMDDPAQRNREAAELAVLTFKGACTMPDGGNPRMLVAGALGWTHITDGELLSFADVDCDRIRTMIFRLVRNRPLEARERALGRALARVVAHELFHMFANTRRHAGRGLLKHYFGPKDLVQGKLQFEPEDLTALRENRLRWLFRPPPPAAGSGH